VIVDSGPLFAALDRNDRDHQRSRALLDGAEEPLIIPAPVLVEVDYWIRERLYPGLFVLLLDEIDRGVFTVEPLTGPDYHRIRALCHQYSDADLGLVDASVLAIAERLNVTQVATLDHRHFRMMRPRHVDALTLLPELD